MEDGDERQDANTMSEATTLDVKDASESKTDDSPAASNDVENTTTPTTNNNNNNDEQSSSSSSSINAEAQALAAWVQAVDNARGDESFLSNIVQSVDDLYDGVAFFDVLSTIDPVYFRNPHGADVKDNWVLKTATLKRLYKLMTQYYIEVLHCSPDALSSPDLDALAREKSLDDLCKLGRLVIGIAVRSEQATEHIEAIQSLAIESQQQLMYTIEQVMSSLKPLESENQDRREISTDAEAGELSVADSIMDETDRKLNDLEAAARAGNLEKQYLDLLESHRALQSALDEAKTEKEESAKELIRFREEIERDRNVQADVLMRQEIEKLKADLRRSEDNFAEAESEVERLNGSVSELTRKAEELQRKTEENVKLKDQLEELKHASDKLQRTENVMEKYKKKLEEGAEVRRQLKTLEQQNAELVDRNAAVEDEYKRIAHFKPLMDSYKGQIAELEGKVSTLQRDLNASRYDHEQISVKLRATEEARTKEKEELDLYQERIQELELGGGLAKRKAQGNGVNGAEDLAANNEGLESDEEKDESLEDALSETTMTGLKIQVRKLARELKVAQANKADAGRLLVVENLLQDANKMKDRYEKDYLKEYQTSLKLRREVDTIRAGKADVGDGPEANLALRMRLNETVDELDRVQKLLKELETEHEQTSKELTIARSDLTLVDKDKLDMIEEVRASVNVEKADAERALKQAQDDVREKEEQIRMQLSQINTLLLEKVDLQSDGIEQRDGALQRELELGDLRASMQNKSLVDNDVQASLTESERQLKATQEKLQKARTFIRQQDKMIKDAFAQRSRQTAAPEELIKRTKAMEQENKVLRQEQAIMSSAWYDLQARGMMMRGIGGGGGNGNGNGNGHGGGAGSSATRAHTKAALELHGLKPKSWLQQQRGHLSGGILLARR